MSGLTWSSPTPCPAAKVATEAGTAAHEAHCDKIETYLSRFEVPGGAFEPIAVETGGRLHPESHNAIKAFVRHALGI